MKYQQFTAISQLTNKLSDHLVITEEMMDSALARQCTDFQSNIYTKLQVKQVDLFGDLNKYTISTPLLRTLTRCLGSPRLRPTRS